MTKYPNPKGNHTWDLSLDYCCCPDCGYIFENREQYIYRMGQYVKELECPRCSHEFVLKKNIKPRIGPFFGEGERVEMEWGER